MFINNWLYNIYNNEDYLYISTRGTICNNWLSIIITIYVAILICNYYKVSLSRISIISQIIISFLTIGSLQLADMLADKIIRGLNLISERQEEVLGGIANLNTRLGEVETQTEGIATLNTRLGNVETQTEGINTRLGNVETQTEGIETLINRRLGSVETQMEGIQTLNTRMVSIVEMRMEGIQTLNTQMGRIEQMMQALTAR